MSRPGAAAAARYNGAAARGRAADDRRPDPGADAGARVVGTGRAPAAAVVAAFVVQLPLLAVAGWANRHLINPDAVAYLRIAGYYASGQVELMISGYWGPLLSWLIAPWLPLVGDPLLAARAAMAISAVVFLAGGTAVLRALDIGAAAAALGAWLVMAFAVVWSVTRVTPDLLMAGLFCLAAARVLDRRWTAGGGGARLAAGALFGAAYLAKPVALPAVVVLVGAVAALSVIGRAVDARHALCCAAVTLLGAVLVAGPWIALISWKHGGPTLSTSAGVTHALVGPPGVERGLPFMYTFHVPDAGRITSWEDPSGMAYARWSPLENVGYAVHQLKVIHRNAEFVLGVLAGYDWLRMGLFAAVAAFLLCSPWRDCLSRDRWRWAVVPVACYAGPYLPLYALSLRYWVVAYPFLVGASLGFVLHLARAAGGRGGPALLRRLALVLVAASSARPSPSRWRWP